MPSPAPDPCAGAAVPPWLRQRLQAAGGSVPFRQYMEWALHDPEHGAYGSGRLRIGVRGDFVTAPSLGPAFAALLAPQLAAWLQELGEGPLALVESGPGEGQLARQLAEALAAGWPQLAERTELVLVEPNAGMAARARQRLTGAPLPCRWVGGFAELAAAPVRGVLLAHEVLDALAVERVQWDGADWRRQHVVLHEAVGGEASLRLEPGERLYPEELALLEGLGLTTAASSGAAEAGGRTRAAGWCTELHPGLQAWLSAAGSALAAGPLLVIDYALEAWRYYAPQRSAGTLMTYLEQRAGNDPLQSPGEADITAHLCLESLEQAAIASGWQPLGQCRQGEALLALGLAERLHGLQVQTQRDLQELLAEREALLRLVDPHALGDFRWLAFSRGQPPAIPRFLQEPATAA